MFNRLALPLQRTLWEKGWTGLRQVQMDALPLLLDGKDDVVISAATASGKTEAAFLPLLTRLYESRSTHPPDTAWDDNHPPLPTGVILYVAPIKALINDQVTRLQVFCERMDIPVYPWHGDAGLTMRKRFFANPHGIVLITPESLEALLFKRGSEVRDCFAALQAVVVDELHAFMGNVRGMQLQSLLHRLDLQLGRRVQRVGLSATLGDMMLAAEFVRPGAGNRVHIVTAQSEKRQLQLAVKAILRPNTITAAVLDADTHIADELFERLRGANYLVFPNGVGMVEFYADALRQRCERANQPITYFPHHGRIAKSERENTEAQLKHGHLPVSAICTTTLEMGIDIGAIKGIVQIGPPQTVASLCQRIGRAGRREGDTAVLWQYCIVDADHTGSSCIDSLHQELVQAVAVIQLFLAKWYEPPKTTALDYSTLIQQVLSLIGERQGITAAQAYAVLCQSGPFHTVTEAHFIRLLRAMAAKELVMQDANKCLLHGERGERMVNHFSFYAAFPDVQEYRLRHAGKELGTLPMSRRSGPDEVIIFVGRRWRIDSIDHERHLVELSVWHMGKLPKTGGDGLPIHQRVRQQMRALLASKEQPIWLDAAAQSLLRDAQRQYQTLQLDATHHVVEGTTVYLLVWDGDATQQALAVLLRSQGLAASNQKIAIEIKHTTVQLVADAMQKISSQPCPSPEAILQKTDLTSAEKWDWVLPDDLLLTSYASRALSFPEAYEVCQGFQF